MLRIARSQAHELVAEGEIPSVRIGERAKRRRKPDLKAYPRVCETMQRP